ncbi:glycosyltransferase family 9 protein [Streptomyces sp. NPDC006529]|uniref:glycosyltransferase family 9 protein n=1 Tax=Streptomyces sp. NPDC006529 TaxID=3157177 RepID=UPI0033A55758
MGGSPAGAARPATLVLRALGLGDLLAIVPALRALRRAWPAHELVLAAPARLRSAALATGLVDRLLPADAPGRAVPAALSWTGPPPEVAVDLHGNGPPSHLLLRALRPGRLLAYRHPDLADLPGPHWDAHEHERSRWCRLLAWYGIDADPDDLRIAPPAVPSPALGAVLLHPGADAGARRWPARRFAEVARALHRAGAEVLVTAGHGEGRLAHHVARRAGLRPEAVIGGDDDVPFGDLAALVAHARCLVAGDTGPAHLASALGTPSVVLFGPVSPALWGPPRHGPHRALWRPGPGEDPYRPGDPHALEPDDRLLRITVEEVLAAVAELPERRPGPRPLRRAGT